LKVRSWAGRHGYGLVEGASGGAAGADRLGRTLRLVRAVRGWAGQLTANWVLRRCEGPHNPIMEE